MLTLNDRFEIVHTEVVGYADPDVVADLEGDEAREAMREWIAGELEAALSELQLLAVTDEQVDALTDTVLGRINQEMEAA